MPNSGQYVSVAETVTDKAVASTRVVTIACGRHWCTKFSATAAILTVGLRQLHLARRRDGGGIDLRLQPAPAALEHSVVHGRRDAHEQDGSRQPKIAQDATRVAARQPAQRAAAGMSASRERSPLA